jgi:hypothetical protein
LIILNSFANEFYLKLKKSYKNQVRSPDFNILIKLTSNIRAKNLIYSRNRAVLNSQNNNNWNLDQK